jgi:hypothetical protein
MTGESPTSTCDLKSRRRRVLLAAILPLLAMAAALSVSWLCWINPLIDSPREMAMASRIADGQRLYADVIYYYGPIGPWVSGLAVSLFGHYFIVLELLSVLLTVLLFALLFVLTRRAGSTATALAAVAAGIAICVAAPRGGSFVFPYSSSTLFALVAGFAALVASTGRRTLDQRVLATACLSMSLLSRGEIGMAAAIVLVIAALRTRQTRRQTFIELAVVGGALLEAGLVYLICFHGTPFRELVADGPLKHYVGLSPQWKTFYLQTAGLLNLNKSGAQLGFGLLIDGVVLAIAATFRPPLWLPSWIRRTAFPALASALFVLYCCSRFSATSKNLPPVLIPMPIIAGVAALWLLRRRFDETARARFLLFAFSTVVASRIVLNMALGPLMSPYVAGPLPGLLAVAAVLCGDVLTMHVRQPEVFRRRLAVLLAGVTLLYLYRIERAHWREHLVRLETSAGPLRLPARQALPISNALEFLKDHSQPGETMASFPESGFFNFIVALKNPLREDQIMPGQLDSQSEQVVADQLATDGPRYVMLTNRPTGEFGAIAFGRDYASEVWGSVESHYSLAGTFGSFPTAPVGAASFFVRIYERSSVRRPGLLLARAPSPETMSRR